MLPDRRVAIFQETLEIAEKTYTGQIASMKKNVIYYIINPADGTLKSHDPRTQKSSKLAKVKPATQPTNIDVENNDSFLSAQLLVERGFNPLVLDMANRFSVGGSVVYGSAAQEEDLCRCSTLYLGLAEFGDGKGRGATLAYKETIPEFGAIYVPGVTVFRSSQNQYQVLEKAFSVDVIALAGYDLGNPDHLEPHLEAIMRSGDRKQLLTTFKEQTKIKIRCMFEVALQTGHDSLVAGALSCGAFKLYDDRTDETSQQVLAAYREVLEESRYKTAFKQITFAVLANQNQPYNNFDVFNDGNLKTDTIKFGNFMIAKNRFELVADPQAHEGRACCELSMPITTAKEIEKTKAFLESKGCEIYQVHDFNNFIRIKINPAHFDQLIAAVAELKPASSFLKGVSGYFQAGSGSTAVTGQESKKHTNNKP